MKKLKMHYYKYLNSQIKSNIFWKISVRHKKPITRKNMEKEVIKNIATPISLLISYPLTIVFMKKSDLSIIILAGGMLLMSSFLYKILYDLLIKIMLSPKQKELIYSVGKIEGKKQYVFYQKINFLFLLLGGALGFTVFGLLLHWVKPLS